MKNRVGKFGLLGIASPWCIHTTLATTLLLFIPLLGGCSGLIKYNVSVLKDISAPKSQTQGSSVPWTVKTTWPRNISLKSADLAITVEVQNERDSGLTLVGLVVPMIPVHYKNAEDQQRQLVIWVQFEATRDGFVIDPSGVDIRDARGVTLKPSVFGPGKKPFQGADAGQVLRKRCVADDGRVDANSTTGGQVEISGRPCFVFSFDTDPSPEREFTLRLGKLEQRGQAIVLPDITFIAGSVWLWITVP
jgi:hypothetical protein